MKITPELRSLIDTRARQKAHQQVESELCKLDDRRKNLSVDDDPVGDLQTAIESRVAQVRDPAFENDLFETKKALYKTRISGLQPPHVPEPAPIVVQSAREIIGPLEPKQPDEDWFIIGAFRGGDRRERNDKRVREGLKEYERRKEAARVQMEQKKTEYDAEVAAKTSQAISDALGDD